MEATSRGRTQIIASPPQSLHHHLPNRNNCGSRPLQGVTSPQFESLWELTTGTSTEDEQKRKCWLPRNILFGNSCPRLSLERNFRIPPLLEGSRRSLGPGQPCRTVYWCWVGDRARPRLSATSAGAGAALVRILARRLPAPGHPPQQGTLSVLADIVEPPCFVLMEHDPLLALVKVVRKAHGQPARCSSTRSDTCSPEARRVRTWSTPWPPSAVHALTTCCVTPSALAHHHRKPHKKLNKNSSTRRSSPSIAPSL